MERVPANLNIIEATEATRVHQLDFLSEACSKSATSNVLLTFVPRRVCTPRVRSEEVAPFVRPVVCAEPGFPSARSPGRALEAAMAAHLYPVCNKKTCSFGAASATAWSACVREGAFQSLRSPSELVRVWRRTLPKSFLLISTSSSSSSLAMYA